MSHPVPTPSLAERVLGWRNRLIASPRFQAWAARMPLTRPIARAQAAGLFDLVAGFTYSQVLAACVELELPQMLAGGPLSTQEVATRAALSPVAAERLLKAAVAVGLVRRARRGWMLGQRGAALLGNPGVLAMVRHHGLLYADLADPVGLLRGRAGTLGDYWAYARSPAPGAVSTAQITNYSALMAASQPMIAAQALGTYPFARHERLLDIGCGAGAFLLAVGRAHPTLPLTGFDLPAVAEAARTALAAAGWSTRAEVFGGNMFADPLPSGADLVSLVRVLHDHDDAAAQALLARIRAILPHGGKLLIVEPMAGTTGAKAVGDAYFGFYLLAMGSGRARTPAEIRTMCQVAGFARTRLLDTSMPMLARAIVAQV